MRLSLRLLAAALAIATAPAAHAAAVVLWPVDPVIAADQRSTAIWIENRGDKPVTMQVRAFGWSQHSGEDDYIAQDAVVSSPPIAEIAPGARQMIRVIRREAAPAVGERAYRMLIDEIPAPPEAKAPGPVAALAVQMRYSIPLFAYAGAAEVTPALSGRIVLENGRRFLEVRNGGTRHARLSDLKLSHGDHHTMLISGLVGYVLAGATRRLPLQAGPMDEGQLHVAVNGVQQPLASTT